MHNSDRTCNATRSTSHIKLYRNNARPRPFCRIAKWSIVRKENEDNFASPFHSILKGFDERGFSAESLQHHREGMSDCLVNY